MAHVIDDTCIGCGACLRACPVDAISGQPKQLHDIDASICIDCGACTFSCPVACIETPAGENPERIRKRNDWPKPVIHEDNCTGCTFCVDICPYDCLEIDTGQSFNGIAVLTDPKACVGCGMCEEVCAKSAISVPGHRSFNLPAPLAS